jgi:AraC family transcriptional regulator
VGITPDDPYVVDNEQIRFDAGIPIAAPIDPPHPFTYRQMPAQVCVAHRHTGGAEQIAKTFAAIGVQWMPSEGWRLRCAPPFEIHHVDQRANDAVRVSWTDAYVPLDHHPDHHPGEGP